MVKMVSLKQTKGEKEAADKALNASVSGAQTADSHGFDVHLDHHHLKKLGIDELPEVGSKHTIAAKAAVSHTSESDSGAGENRRLTLRITHMGMEPDSDDKGGDDTDKDGDKYPSKGSLRSDIARITEESEAKRIEKQKLREARKAKKVPE